MGGEVFGALLQATARAGDGRQSTAAEGYERSYRWIWCMLGNEDEPSGLVAWAATSWRVGTRRAYAQKLAKIAEFQDATGEASLVGVLAGFLAAKAEAGERQSTTQDTACAMRLCSCWTTHPTHPRSSAARTAALYPWAPSPICPAGGRLRGS